MPRYRARLVLAVFVASLLPCDHARADDWETYAHDLSHPSRSGASFNPQDLHFAWKAPQGYATPLIVGDYVIATKNGFGTGNLTTITSFRISDGAVNWSYSNNWSFPSQAGYGNGFVAVAAQSKTDSSDIRLYALDAANGALMYTVPINNANMLMPQVRFDPITGATTAYIGTNAGCTAVSLGAASGSVLFNTASSSVGGDSIPTLIGNSIVMAGPGQFYAFDAATGARNHFKGGALMGGGGTTIAADPAASRFYVLEDFGVSGGPLTAYSYTSNSSITQLWNTSGAGIVTGGSVAIGPTGLIYSVDNSTLTERDPLTGDILRSVSGSFANAVTPIIEGHYLWAYSQSSTLAYDLNTMTLLRTLPGSRGSSNSAYDVGGALDDSHFIIDYGDAGNSPGFDVYVVPEPLTAPLVLLATAAWLKRRRKAR
jgi:hypothetical protein